MRQITIRVSDDHREALLTVLKERGIDFVVVQGGMEMADASIVEFPLPTDAVGDILTAIDDAGIDESTYTVVGAVEAAMTPNTDRLLDQYADNFDPIAVPELRSKARDLSRDPASFISLVGLSAMIATVGLLEDTPAIVIGSMVIAPLVGPILTSAVGTVTADYEMLLDSLLIQAVGLLVSIAVAAALAEFVVGIGVLPSAVDITAIESIATRIAPTPTTVIVGMAAGAASAYGLATKGPTSLIGVMIAAALIPSAATVGIAIAWNDPRVMIGTLLLLITGIILINVAAVAVLLCLGYRPPPGVTSHPDSRRIGATIVLALVVIGGLGVAGGIGTVQHATFQQQTTHAVQEAVEESAGDELSIVSIRTEYGGPLPTSSPATVTVMLSGPGNRDDPALATTIGERVEEAVARNATVRVRYLPYHQWTRARGR